MPETAAGRAFDEAEIADQRAYAEGQRERGRWVVLQPDEFIAMLDRLVEARALGRAEALAEDVPAIAAQNYRDGLLLGRRQALAAVRAVIADWRSVPRNGYDEEGQVRHDIETDCADIIEDAIDNLGTP